MHYCLFGALLALNLASANSQAVLASNQDRCLLPKQEGICRASLFRFYFNDATKKCQTFLFGGCRGNLNNFRSLQECHETCKHRMTEANRNIEVHVKTTHCLQPPVEPDQVQCRAYFPSIFYNQDTHECQEFIYGGCGATANVYNSMEQCRSTCYFDDSLGIGMRTGFGTRMTVPRIIEDDAVVIQEDQSEENICKLPPVTPHLRACLAFMQKWTYDFRQGKCIQYIYGGCHGTANLFDSQAECESNCPAAGQIEAAPPVPTLSSMWIQPPFCQEPPMRGMRSCMAMMQKFTFNSAQGQCVPYVYGGCGGTENLFDTEEDCQTTCDQDYVVDTYTVPRTLDVCGLDIDSGPCRMSKPMFGFNQETKRCEKFFYGGCRGNENRFRTVEECVDTCGGNEPEIQNGLCSLVKCDRKEAIFFQAKGCKPITKAGECCPSSWDCTVWNEQRLNRKNECFWADASNSNGKFYAIGEDIPEASYGCTAACTCVQGPEGEADVICAVADCFWEPTAPGANCTQLYQSLDQCCPTKKCDAELSALPTCEFKGQTYVQGQKVSDNRENPCEECICQENGQMECQDAKCGLNKNAEMLKGCVPIFRDNVCCPVDWMCPLPAQAPRLVRPPALAIGTGGASVRCPPGVNPRRDFQDYIRPPSVNIEEVDKLGSRVSTPQRPTRVTLPAFVGPNADLDPCLGKTPLDGACEPYLDRWTFDLGAKVCRPYKTSYNSGGIVNSFLSQRDCQTTCHVHIPQERRCLAKLEIGQDITVVPDRCMPPKRFRFNEATARCEDFSRFGCTFNSDSYRTIEECQANCINPETTSPLVRYVGKKAECNLSTKVGNCRSRLKRFYYDDRSGICRPFFYSGCQGNENNFVSENACIQTCVPEARTEVAAIPRALFLGDPCSMKKEVGHCRASKPMYFFDAEQKVCKLFFYGGCGGNANRFSTLEECKGTCTVDASTQEALDSGEVCSQSCNSNLITDNSTSQFEQWSFENGQCQWSPFQCSSPANRFESRDVCNAYCNFQRRARTLPAEAARPVPLPAQVEDPCLMDKVVGRCRASVRRYFFDQASGKCKGFFYGGCGGNANNYLSEEECERRCRRHLTPDPALNAIEIPLEKCSLPVDTGPCRAFKPRFAFNSQLGKCERFMYGGCRGNENNFKTRRECAEACSNPSENNPRKITLPILVDELPKCEFNGRQFNIGDVLRFAGNDGCDTCTCSSPPALTCATEKCPTIATYGLFSDCQQLKPPGSCCVRSYHCPVDQCEPFCAEPNILLPPDAGTCRIYQDRCGCTRGYICIKEE